MPGAPAKRRLIAILVLLQAAFGGVRPAVMTCLPLPMALCAGVLALVLPLAFGALALEPLTRPA